MMCLLLVAPQARAGEVSDIAKEAQAAWRAGDGETLIKIAHPKLIARMAQLQQAWLEQEVNHTGGRSWIKFPANAPTIERFKALPLADQARSFLDCMHEILAGHAGFTFTCDAVDESIAGANATVTVIEHQTATGGTRDVRYPFVVEQVDGRWRYVSGGSERVHVEMQLMSLAP